MTLYAPPDQIDQVDFAMDNGIKMLQFMEGYFGIRYPLPKAGKYKNCSPNIFLMICLLRSSRLNFFQVVFLCFLSLDLS